MLRAFETRKMYDQGASKSGKTKVTMLQKRVFPGRMVTSSGTSLRSNQGFFSLVKLCFKRARACLLLWLPLREIKIQRSDCGAQDAVEEVLIAILIKQQLAS